MNKVKVIASSLKRQLNKCFRWKDKVKREKIIPIILKIKKKENCAIEAKKWFEHLEFVFKTNFPQVLANN